MEQASREDVAGLLDRGADPSSRDAKGRFPPALVEDDDAIGGTDVYRRLNDGRF